MTRGKRKLAPGLLSMRNRVAVLPFTNMSPEPASEYLADGFTEELISTISRISEMSVISRTSVMQYKKKPKPVRAVRKELNVGTILEGSVRKWGNRIRVSVQMIDSESDKHLWAENYDRRLDDIFAIQSEIAQLVATELKVKLLPGERNSLSRGATESSKAHLLYLKGRTLWNERKRGSLDKAIEYLERAVEFDPKYALAYSGLADCYAIAPDYGWMRPGEAYPRARDYARRAIGIDPSLADPHASLGNVYTNYDWKWWEAEEEFRWAINLKPSYATAYQWYTILLVFMGRFNEAYEQIKHASELDPLSRVIQLNVGEVLLHLGRNGEAVEQLETVARTNPDWPPAHRLLGLACHMDSNQDRAVDELRKAVVLSGGDATDRATLGCVLGLVGRRDEANRIAEDLVELSKTAYVDKAQIASALFGAGRTEEAFRYLEKGIEERSDNILEFSQASWLKEVRNDKRWKALANRMGLASSASDSRKVLSLSEGGSSPMAFEFKLARSGIVFDRLALDFLRDYMVLNYMQDKSGWRTIGEVAREADIPVQSLYSRGGGVGPPFRELLKRGLIEARLSPGQRGRGGEVTKIRVSYEKSPVAEYVNNLARVGHKKD
jgi:TolB-like protein/Tfp pilus assembly protein PilF